MASSSSSTTATNQSSAPPSPSTSPSLWLPISWKKSEIPSDDPNDPGATKTRIDLKIPPRLLSLPPTIFILTSTIGFIRAARGASLRYLAENAHRPPRTTQGWYFYQKTKNYRVALAGLKGAGKEGLRGFAVGCVWVSVEHYWGEVLGSGQILSDQRWFAEAARNTNEVAAGITTSAVVSAIYRLGWRTSFRTLTLGALIGGTLQVLLGIRKGLEAGVAKRRAELELEEEDAK